VTAPLTERLEATADNYETEAFGWSKNGHRYRDLMAVAALLREAKAALEELAAKQRIDQEQCDEMTERAGRYLERAQAAEARVATLTSRLEPFIVLDHRIRQAEKFERRYGIHIGGDSALGAVFAWIDELCAQTRDALAGTDEGAE